MRLKLRYLLLFFIVVCVCVFLVLFFEIYSLMVKDTGARKDVPEVKVLEQWTEMKTKRDCRTHSCVNLFKCHVDSNWQIKVYVYPEVSYITEDGQKIFPDATKEFKTIIEAVKQSRFWTNDSQKACIFIPQVDILSEKPVLESFAGKALNSIKLWKNGENHLLFNFFQKKTSSANPLTMNTGKAMVVSGSFNRLNFRPKFDIVIPVFNSLVDQKAKYEELSKSQLKEARKLLLIIPHGMVTKSMKADLEKLIRSNKESVIHLSFCEGASIETASTKRCRSQDTYLYPEILSKSTFCLIMQSQWLWKTFLSDALMSGCIPVVLQGHLMPFSFVIDWKRASITVNENQMKNLVTILNNIDANQIIVMRKQLLFLWERYFSSLENIVITTLEIINDRISPNTAKSYTTWNGNIQAYQNGQFTHGSYPPLFIPLAPPTQQGFTAVILTYNREHMLFKLMVHLNKCPSLTKILVVWNNVKNHPPKRYKWPKITKPWIIIKTKANKLSNRFYPYKEIETEAILSIDDDISMLTVNEIEFGYKVWREYPDRLVGFPGRYHNQASKDAPQTFHYQSQWNNDVSMVLTGVAFQHKLYSYMFTYKMPSSILKYVDERMNCEDIAMNFLVANLTRKAPIKVTARKRFICAHCSSNESLWSETSHFIKRSECLKKFTQLFGNMPLESVEFRADPVLFRDNVPIELQAFPDIGNV